tara:strand:+ start:567 stop:1181 length:615 start_codon:yes stop_codon:yes gene_type:complete
MNNFKEYELDKKYLMGGWYIPEDICDKMIEFYNLNKHKHALGVSYDEKKLHNIDTTVKQSTDLHLQPNVDLYPLNLYHEALQKCILNYQEKYDEVKNLPKFNITEPYNIQHYEKGGGFKRWHYEGGNSEEPQIKKRLIVFMTYLNDVDDGGTEFKYQNLTTPAKKGLTLIWPVWWTHTHRGQVSHSKEKYIVTGWYSKVENENS